MLVTFKTTAYADITMFGDAATTLLKLMGQSGNIPGAIMGNDVAEALANLNKELANQPELDKDADAGSTGEDDEDEKSNRVALATRAVPLIELLEAAAASNANVMWDA